MAHVELWDLVRMRLMREATFPTLSTPRIADAQDLYFAVELSDYPEKGTSRKIYWRCSDGAESEKLPADTPRCMFLQRDQLTKQSPWLLWRDGAGLAFQGLPRDEKVRLEKTSFSFERVVGPSQNGRFLAIEAKRGGLWETETGRRLVEFPPSHLCRDFDPTGHWAMTVSPTDKEIWVWDMKTGKPAYRCRPEESSAPGFDPLTAEMKLHPSGKRLAVLARGILRLWDVEKNRHVLALEKPGHFAPVRCVAQHSQAGLIASGNEEGLILLWKRDDGRLVRTLHADPAGTVALAFTPDGTRVASASGRGKVSLLDLHGRQFWSVEVARPDVGITRLAFHPSQASLLTCTRDGRLVLFDPKTGSRLTESPLDTTDLQSLALSPDGTLLALGSRAGRVHLWDVARREVRRSWDTLSPVAGLAFVGGSELLATGGQAVQFWETRTGRNVWTLEAPRGPVRALLMDDRTGELAVADQGEMLLLLPLSNLHAHMERLKLNCEAFPGDKWSGTATDTALAAAAGWEEWYRRAEGLLREGEGSAAAWACSQAILRKPEEWKLWDLRCTIRTRELFGSRRDYRVPHFMPSLELQASWEKEWHRHIKVRAFGIGGEKHSRWQSGTPWRETAVRALADYEHAIALNPDNGTIWHQRGEIHLALGEWRRAAEDFTKALDVGADRPAALFGRGLARYQLHQDDLAVADFTETIRLAPAHIWAPVLRCEALRRKTEYDRAIDELTELLRRDRLAAPAHAVRGAVRRDKGDLQAALADLDEAVRLDPDSPYAHTQRGELYRRLGQPDKAIADLQQAIALDARYAGPYNVLGQIHQAKNDDVRAMLDFDETIRLDPEYTAAYYQRGIAHLNRGAYPVLSTILTRHCVSTQHSDQSTTREGRPIMAREITIRPSLISMKPSASIPRGRSFTTVEVSLTPEKDSSRRPWLTTTRRRAWLSIASFPSATVATPSRN
jgi:tetratricopeptide (TPR) repeat protein